MKEFVMGVWLEQFIFKQKMRRLTNRNWGVSMGYQLFKVRHRSLNKKARLDPSLCAYVIFGLREWRPWRKPRTKVQNLLKRGVRIQSAEASGITRKGPL